MKDMFRIVCIMDISNHSSYPPGRGPRQKVGRKRDDLNAPPKRRRILDPIMQAEFQLRHEKNQKGMRPRIPASWDSEWQREWQCYQMRMRHCTPESRQRSRAYRETEQYRRWQKGPKGRWAALKSRSVHDGIQLLLTEDEAIKLFTSPCWYCQDFDSEIARGIDRLSSEDKAPYHPDTTVSACGMCNMIKSRMSLKQFFENITAISLFLRLGVRATDPNRRARYRSFSDQWHGYINRAIKDRIPFLLTEEQFRGLIAQSCAYCGITSCAGIDRLDSGASPYSVDTCVPACKSCNYLKRDYTAEEFLNQLSKICANNRQMQTILERHKML
jgi:hypothetical protein